MFTPSLNAVAFNRTLGTISWGKRQLAQIIEVAVWWPTDEEISWKQAGRREIHDTLLTLGQLEHDYLYPDSASNHQVLGAKPARAHSSSRPHEQAGDDKVAGSVLHKRLWCTNELWWRKSTATKSVLQGMWNSSQDHCRYRFTAVSSEETGLKVSFCGCTE